MDPAALARLVQLVAEGVSVKEACAQVGVARPTLYYTRHAVPSFDEELKAAQASGRRARVEAYPCGTEGAYVHRRCRCPRCTKAATTVRGERRDREGQPGERAGELVPLPAVAVVLMRAAG